MTAMLRGKIAIVTGASSGLGRAIAICFAAEGAVVVVADVRTLPLEGGDSTTEIISLNGGSATFEKTDVSRWKDIDALVTQTVARHGRLDIMVNNAAIFSATGLLDTTGAQWQQVLDVNLTGMFNGCKRAVQQMITQDHQLPARYRIRREQGGSDLPHPSNRGRLRGSTHCLQLHFPGQNHEAPG
jgi:glucose 1-dehydrogenase